MCTCQLLKARGVVVYFRRGKLRRHLHVAVFNLIKLFVKR